VVVVVLVGSTPVEEEDTKVVEGDLVDIDMLFINAVVPMREMMGLLLEVVKDPPKIAISAAVVMVVNFK